MEKNKHVTTYLNDYIKMPNPRYAVLLKGQWGCGKTFFIKKLIETWNKGRKSKGDNIQLKPIYISLYGISSTKAITEKIKSILNPFLYSKGFKIGKEMLIGAVKLTTKIDFDINRDGKDDGSLSFDINSLALLTEKNDKIKGNKVLIFDDLERCKVPLDELFGYVNVFVEHNQCKVILLADEDRINKEEKSNGVTYIDFKEKLIGQTIEILPDSNSAIDFFLEESKSEVLRNNQALVYDMFIASKLNNLRILRQCFSDFLRLESIIREEFKKHPKYNDFIKESLYYFILFYSEYKSGNTDVKSFLDGSLISVSEEYKEVQTKYRAKYFSIKNKNDFKEPSDTLKGELIIDYVNTGRVDINSLDESLQHNRFFRDSKMPLWEELKNFLLLSNSEFIERYNQFKDEFENNKIDDVYVVLQACGIFIYLNDKEVMPYDKENIVHIAKANIDRIVIKSNFIPKNQFYSRDAYKEGYLASETKEFQDVERYLSEKNNDKLKESEVNYLKNYFEKLDDKTIGDIYVKMEHPIPDESRNYKSTPIFKDINIELFVKQIIKLNNSSKNELYFFIRRRYQLDGSYSLTEIVDYRRGDLESLEKMEELLIEEIKKSEYIEKYNLTRIAEAIKVSIDKLNKSKDVSEPEIV